jgi:hypothetical protein
MQIATTNKLCPVIADVVVPGRIDFLKVLKKRYRHWLPAEIRSSQILNDDVATRLLRGKSWTKTHQGSCPVLPEHITVGFALTSQ